jgi:retron-type reverse transcriptase
MKTKPRLLQDWQAYQALTYESKWKAIVDKEWGEYKLEWELAHPKETLPKKRFTFMVEFMKEKYKNETDEMKQKCEEYRKARKSETPGPSDSNTLRNLEFQSYVLVSGLR